MDHVKVIYRPLAARAARQVVVGRNRAASLPKPTRCSYDDQTGSFDVNQAEE